ncbi:MAG: metallophosphoesterase family protein [Anaerolineae bacterium]|nr:metallophosphoesterase family protein [Anaerolineae bacterium]
MKLGIFSDTHNHTSSTQAALEMFRARGIMKLIHCGDITTPDILFLFAGWDITCVFGNMDLNRSDLVAAAKQIGLRLPQNSHEVEADGVLIGVTHGHDANLLAGLIISGKYPYVCHGHTHHRRDEFQRPYSVRVINPGAMGGYRPETRSVCILDTESGQVEFVEFPDLT